VELVKPRVENACRRAVVDNGQTLFSEFQNKVPSAMFVVMPVFALFMKLFYWRPTRYFIEHLMFQLYNHSAFFIAGSALQVGEWFVPAGQEWWLSLALLVYFFQYAYRSLRTYYGESRMLTLLKFVWLGQVYMLLIAGAMVAAALATVV
jgi:hypothetical protein